MSSMPQKILLKIEKNIKNIPKKPKTNKKDQALE
jgi:hypothetical protein